jgi:hypothetical protein
VSFDVFVQRFQNGDGAAWDWPAVHEALARLGLRPEEVADGTEVAVADGGRAEADVDADGAAFFVRAGGLTPELARLVWELAAAGRAVVLPTMDPMPAVLTDASQLEHLPADLDATPLLCESAGELQSVLESGFDQWTRYLASGPWRGAT